jgi:perosamine synthetase
MSISDTLRHNTAHLLVERYLCVGYNYRMSDLHAAVGLAQLARLDELVARRRALAARYNQAFADDPNLQTPFVPPDTEPNYQSYILQLAARARIHRNELLTVLRTWGVAAKPGIMTIHREPAFGGRCAGPLTNSEQASEGSVLLPLYPDMSASEQNQVITAVRDALRTARPTGRAAARCEAEIAG